MSRSALLTLALILPVSLAAASPARAQAHDHGSHGTTACDACPAPRESSGTAWQPGLAGAAHPYRALGPAWWLGTHAQVAVTATDERGPRGDSGVFAPNHGMLNLRRRLGTGTFAIRTMWSIEPLMGAEGYPLLLQSGETADGVNPLADRQHPHDMVMELAVAYQRPLESGAQLSLYLAAVGEPALGPPAYMHRPSGELLPIAPITHHWFDSTHTTQGVFTAGFAPNSNVRIEASAFRGREPDQHRWNLETPKLDSFSARLSINPTPSFAIQASAGFLKDAERIHLGANVTRMTASVMYARRGPRVSLDATAAIGRNARTATMVEVPGGFYYSPGATSPAILGEATIGLLDRHRIIVRAEAADKGELFPVADPRHLDQFAVLRTTLGYALSVMRRTHATLHVGAAWSHSRMAEALRADYGGSQAGYLGFVRMSVH